MPNVIEFRNITKYFPGVKALDSVSFTANGGEVLALMGENGAGKSTLLKILNGDYQQDMGEYLINGQACHFNNPREAVAAGIGVIYQERQIMLELTVGENMFLGRLPSGLFGRIKMNEVHEKAQKIIDEFGLDMKSTDKVKDLSVAYQQMVEIMKAYSRENLKMIAFDEPTASLSGTEIESLFRIIQKLKAEGKVIIYVSHRMAEIRDIADRVAIFKDGCFVGDSPIHEITDEELIQKMVGRDLGDIFSSLDKKKEIGEVILDVRNLKSPYLKEASFVVRAGEIVGFSGLVSAGRTEVVRAITGADPQTGGEVWLDGKKIQCKTPHDAIKNGIVMVPEDRKLQGIIPRMSVGRNITVGSLDALANRLGVINSQRETEIGLEGKKNFNIKTPDLEKPIVELSGGNQQKAIVARWLSTDPRILILDEPTKGIDIGAKSEFYNMICDIAKRGIGVILISSELPEVLGLSDRILVMRGKQIVGEIDATEATEEELLTMAMMEGSVYG
ncbi:MAG: sugar ABC transporter ATP-binding protein [Lachnospiraceae bacterium]|nr:sugar ABC transporter ATP-binding protein [Lachnospiraceae bacterium]